VRAKKRDDIEGPCAEILLLVIPAKAGLRRPDAEANIRAANGPYGARQEPRVIQFLALAEGQVRLPRHVSENTKTLDSGLRRNDELWNRTVWRLLEMTGGDGEPSRTLLPPRPPHD